MSMDIRAIGEAFNSAIPITMSVDGELSVTDDGLQIRFKWTDGCHEWNCGVAIDYAERRGERLLGEEIGETFLRQRAASLRDSEAK